MLVVVCKTKQKCVVNLEARSFTN